MLSLLIIPFILTLATPALARTPKSIPVNGTIGGSNFQTLQSWTWGDDTCILTTNTNTYAGTLVGTGTYLGVICTSPAGQMNAIGTVSFTGTVAGIWSGL